MDNYAARFKNNMYILFGDRWSMHCTEDLSGWTPKTLMTLTLDSTTTVNNFMRKIDTLVTTQQKECKHEKCKFIPGAVIRPLYPSGEDESVPTKIECRDCGKVWEVKGGN